MSASFCQMHKVWHPLHHECTLGAPARMAVKQPAEPLDWALLKATATRRIGPTARVPVFQPALARLDGRRVALTGFMAPYAKESAYSHFMLSPLPP